MAVGYLLIGLGFASNALTRTIPLLVFTTALFTLGEMISMPVAGAYVADLAPPHRRGLYMGTYGLVWALAFVCGPSLGMALFSASPLALWASCGVLGVVAAGIILAEPRQRRADATGRAAPEPRW
jgi:MFS family permease